MSTGQMYVGKGNNIPSTERTGKKAPQTAQNEAQQHTATLDQLSPLLTSWASMRQWAVDSPSYIKRRQHLSATEKAKLNVRLDQYATHLGSLIQFYRNGTRQLPACDLELEYNNYQIGQASFNQYAQYYEFPRYPLDPAVRPDKGLLLGYIFEVIGNEYDPILFEKDQLFTSRITSFAQLEPADLLCIVHRQDYKHSRFFKIGWYKRIVDNYLVLAYDRPRLKVKQSDWGISLFEVVHIYKVDTLQRDR